MASRGKTTDRSTEWSGYAWDEQGFWVSSRLDAHGERQYDYRYPERAQTPQEHQSTPRSPGANVLTSKTNYGGYANSAGYTTSTSTSVSSYTSQPTYTVAAAATTTSAYVASDTESEVTVRDSTLTSGSPYVATSAYLATSQAYQSSPTTATVTQALSSMAIAGPSSSNYANGNPPSETSPPNIAPNNENYGKLDSRYKVVDERKQKKFWIVGRVFMVLWTEPARKAYKPGILSTNGSQTGQFSTTYLEGTAFSEIRRFVVVGEGYGNSICSPIHTYGGQATLKHNLPEPTQHAIIYTSSRPPSEHGYYDQSNRWIQENLTKDPIKVISEQSGPEGDLGNLSRINYSKVYTVENYVKVLNIGVVAPESMQSLARSSFVKPRDGPIERPRVNTQRTNSHRDDNKPRDKGKEKRRR